AKVISNTLGGVINADLKLHFDKNKKSLRKGQLRSLEGDLQITGIRLERNFFEAYFNMGLSALSGGDMDTALRAYEYALAIRPDHRDSRFNLSLALKQRDHLRDAARELEALLRQDKTDLPALLQLGELYSGEQTDFNVSMKGKSLYQFLTQRGRVGQRYARRFWETEGSIGRDRMLYLVVCKKWHVAKRFVNQFGPHIDGPLLEYIFNETYENIPDLGGILSSEEKKSRHRRSLVRMLFEYYKTDRLLLCLDPGDFDILQDFCSDIALTRVLEIVCLMDDDYILGHAKRVNLISDTTPAEAISTLLPSIRNELNHQSERITDAGFDNFFRITEQGNLKKNSDQIKLFCELDEETATAIMEQDWLFAD
ncbi:MAG: hypothetical protein EBY35_14740, partial [Rhodobacteraceae bacterium]|nr:hypothetical protein [Paracoccaceae bacterium]